MSPALGFGWRLSLLSGVALGLATAPVVGPVPAPAVPVAVAAAAGALLVALAPARLASGAPARGPATIAWLALVCAVAACAGLGAGSARLVAIDAGALTLEPGGRVRLTGFVAAVPRRRDGMVRVIVDSARGRAMVEAPEPVGDLDVGAAVAAQGTLRLPAEFERDSLERLGIRRVLATREITALPARRGGVQGVFDAIRIRAQAALSSGTPEASAALLRGFVLGQDDRIDARTVDEFKRSGLAHLLAVSGQNVVLLAILAMAVLAVAGVGLRARLVAVLGLIGVYVIVTGAGPSIQRAGLMGAAGLVAALAGRPASRWYALGFAAAATLAVDPRSGGDIGWQLSFAAVAGILLIGTPLSRALAGGSAGRGRRAMAEAAAITLAATLATAPLMSLHFGTVSVVSLPANLIAVVAEAPVMWLGMVAAAAGQIAWLPVEPVTWLAGLFAAYIAQVASWFAAPAWAQVELTVGGVTTLVGVYAGLGAATFVGLRAIARRRAMGARPLRGALPAVALATVTGVASVSLGGIGAEAPTAAAGLEIRVLDVGQGDAILLRPARGEPILVDAGPPGGAATERLDELGVDSLAALVITHPDLDHAGGAGEVLGAVRVARLLVARADRALLGAAASAGAGVRRVAAGSAITDGRLRLEVLWPRPDTARSAAAPNEASLVLLARWGGFRMLLTGDAEAELAPVHPGEVDVLKVAHHGSEDAGLASLLAEADPELGVISVGEGNPYGHPAPATMATLAGAGVTVARTDSAGEVALAVRRRGWNLIDRDGG